MRKVPLISFSKNVNRSLHDGLAAVLDVKRVEKHDKYLGLPMEVGASKLEAFSYLIERIRKRTQGWRDKTLSISGKQVYMWIIQRERDVPKNFKTALPHYVMPW